MRSVEEIQAEMDAAEEAHQERMNALEAEIYAVKEAADPGCHEREREARISAMTESIREFERMRRVMTRDSEDDDEDGPSKETSE